MKTKKKYKRSVKENITGYLFITPYLIGFLIFQGIPFLMAFFIGFTDIKFISKLDQAKFVGINNFIKMFKDREVMAALGRTGLYTLIYVPLIMVAGFTFAYLINKKVYFRKTIRTFLFMPYVSNMIAIAVVFKLLLSPKGPLLSLLQQIGIENPPIPLFDLKLVLPVVATIAVWKDMGLNMVTFLAALQDVPRELIEAAEIDGAGKWSKVKNIIIPLISPTSFFLLISSMITSLQNFTIIKGLTDGGPGQATTVLSVKIVDTAFTKYQTGYASAQAIILFVIVLCITLIQWRGQKKWVNY